MLVVPGGGSSTRRALVPGEVAFTIEGLEGAFDRAEVKDSAGVITHTAVAHATVGVAHLHWFDAAGVCVGRASRPWLPPSEMWLFAPRSEEHSEVRRCKLDPSLKAPGFKVCQ